LIRSIAWASELGDPYWGEEHVLIALAEAPDELIQEVFESFNISVDDLLAAWKQIMDGQ
jgi:ATP-dependent Clp protease ATP-binding subunit ClpA